MSEQTCRQHSHVTSCICCACRFLHLLFFCYHLLDNKTFEGNVLKQLLLIEICLLKNLGLDPKVMALCTDLCRHLWSSGSFNYVGKYGSHPHILPLNNVIKKLSSVNSFLSLSVANQRFLLALHICKYLSDIP